MSSKAARKRNKKKFKLPPNTKVQEVSNIRTAPAQTSRPTPERLSQGRWATPQGMGKDMQPMVDLASDMIGALYQSKQITTSQEQAARLFQELRAGYLSELEVAGYKSCLAGGVRGYDGGDGNVEAIKAYRSLESRIGRIKTACLILECDRGQHERPINLEVLRRSLDAVSVG